MTRLIALAALLFTLAACEVVPVQPAPAPQAPDTTPIPARAQQAAQRFLNVVETVEPVAERECRQRARALNCDFLIVVDDRPGQQPNAFQTLDRSGRPVVAFNLALIAMAQNEDELAFIMGHEASHHIRDHLSRQRQSADAGAVIFGGLATLTGGNADTVRSAQELGAMVGARTYSKDFELEADQLGTIIAYRSGFDPETGARFFSRIPDPGNRFLGTHPPNASRMDVVRRTLATLR